MAFYKKYKMVIHLAVVLILVLVYMYGGGKRFMEEHALLLVNYIVIVGVIGVAGYYTYLKRIKWSFILLILGIIGQLAYLLGFIEVSLQAQVITPVALATLMIVFWSSFVRPSEDHEAD